jgi:hypothetical protein
MPNEITTVLIVLISATLWFAAKHVVAMHQSTKQREIARRGRVGEGRVVAIQRPFLLDNCTRLYFDFLPEGTQHAVRACHVDRRSPEELRAALPAQGALVSVRYLPERPRQAVIGKLVF